MVRPTGGGAGRYFSEIESDPERARLTFTASNEAADITFADTSSTYAATDIETRNDLERVYRRAGNSQDTLDIWLHRPDSKYLVVARQVVKTLTTSPAETRDDTGFFLSGVPTVGSDMPKTRGIQIRALFRGSGYGEPGRFFGGGGGASFDFENGIARAGLDYVMSGGGPGGGGTGTAESGQLSFFGRFQPGANRIEGTVTGDGPHDRRYTGTFVGMFFGPQATEYGFVCRLTRNDGYVLVGVVYGARDD